jgi:hypothetical protein
MARRGRPSEPRKHWLEIGLDYYHGGETDKKALAEKYHCSLSHVRNALAFYDATSKEIDWSEVKASDVRALVPHFDLPEASGEYDWTGDGQKPSDELRRKLIGIICDAKK